MYAAPLAGWAVVSVGATLFMFALMIFETNVIGLSYLIPVMLVAAAGSLLAAIPICLVFGLSALAVVERLQLQQRWQWAAAGAVVGLLIVLLLAAVPTFITPLIVAPVVVLFAIAGAIAGAVAWRERIGAGPSS
ncbi:MAG: hypothetical protein R3C46_14830 [Hyphomonadaceae bacterium]